MIETIKTFLSDVIGSQGVALDLLVLAGISVAAVAIYYMAKGVLYLLDIVVNRTPTNWDDDLLNHRLMRAVAQLAPALFINAILPGFFDDATSLHHWTRVLTSFYIVWAVVHIFNIFLTNLYEAMSKRPELRSYAVKGVFQMCKLVAIGLGVIVGLSLLIGKTPLAIITAIGASAAVLMLVFRDTILGLVASVQLTANKMLHRGDWISAPKYDVNGEVIDVSLTTVKVRNWDNSISTIPPYSLISDSFRNYQAMRDIGGRRVERAIIIDLNTIRYLTEAEMDDLKAKTDMGEVLDQPGLHRTNVALFRYYIEHYLEKNDDVNREMLYMVREMEPTPAGLPLQIYFFTPITEWKAFERLQSDVMDHIYASVGLFKLKMYQAPSGNDISSISANQRGARSVS